MPKHIIADEKKRVKGVGQKIEAHGCSQNCPTATPQQKWTYSSWKAMKQRCYNKNNNRYKYYGGKGIRVSKRWNRSFKAFLEDMGLCPKNKTLDRIDNSGHYIPSNCKWSTTKEQNRNTRRTYFITFQGKTQCLAAWAEELGFNETTLWYRLNSGWSVQETLTTPSQRYSK